jgi:hypothetical protein
VTFSLYLILISSLRLGQRLAAGVTPALYFRSEAYSDATSDHHSAR